MNVTIQEIRTMFKKKTTIVALMILSLGTFMCAWLSVEQGGRIMKDGILVEGKQALLYTQSQNMVLNGAVSNEQINNYLQYLYQYNQHTSLSLDEMINFLHQEDMISYNPYTSLLLRIYESPQSSYVDTYQKLYELGVSDVDIYQDWRSASVANLADAKEATIEDLKAELALVTTPFHYEANAAVSVMSSKLQDLMLLLYIVIAILFASLYSKDRSTNAYQVIQTTTLGKKPLAKARCNAACIVSTGLFLYTVLLYSGVIISQVGLGSFSTSIQMSLLALSPYNLHEGQAYMLLLVLAYGMNMMITMGILYASCISKKAYHVIILSFLCLFISYMITQTATFEGASRYFMMLLPFALFEKSFVFSYCNIMLGSYAIWYPWVILLSFFIVGMGIRWRIVKRG